MYNHNTAHEAHVIAYAMHALDALTDTGDVIESPATFVGEKVYATRSPERREMHTEEGIGYRLYRDLDARGTESHGRDSAEPTTALGDSIMDPDLLGMYRATVTEARMADRTRAVEAAGGTLDTRKRARKTTAKRQTRAQRAAAIRERRESGEMTPRFPDDSENLAEARALRAEVARERNLEDYSNNR